jgi:hypothetical protein
LHRDLYPRRIMAPLLFRASVEFQTKSVAARYRTNVLNTDIGQRSRGAIKTPPP